MIKCPHAAVPKRQLFAQVSDLVQMAAKLPPTLLAYGWHKEAGLRANSCEKRVGAPRPVNNATRGSETPPGEQRTTVLCQRLETSTDGLQSNPCARLEPKDTLHLASARPCTRRQAGEAKQAKRGPSRLPTCLAHTLHLGGSHAAGHLVRAAAGIQKLEGLASRVEAASTCLQNRSCSRDG